MQETLGDSQPPFLVASVNRVQWPAQTTHIYMGWFGSFTTSTPVLRETALCLSPVAKGGGRGQIDCAPDVARGSPVYISLAQENQC